MNIYKNILIEINDAQLSFKDRTLCYGNHAWLFPCGVAYITRSPVDGYLYADIETIQNLSGLYPSVGYCVGYPDSMIMQLGLCTERNEDERILPIP